MSQSEGAALGAYKNQGGLCNESYKYMGSVTSQMHQKSASDDEVTHMRGYLDRKRKARRWRRAR